MVSSLKVAEHFEKRHKDVLKAIKNLEIPEEFRERNFAPSEYAQETGIGQTRKYPMYLMTRDGFTLLAMGFTGKKAMQWKIRYIEAFNAMEKRLAEETLIQRVLEEDAPQDTPAIEEEKTTPAERTELRSLVKVWANKLFFKPGPAEYTKLWKMVQNFCGIKSIKDMPRSVLPKAIEYVKSQIDQIEEPCFEIESSTKENNLPVAQNFNLFEVQMEIGKLQNEIRNFLLSMQRHARQIVCMMKWDKTQAGDADRIVLELCNSAYGVLQATIQQLDILARQRNFFV